MTKRAGSALLDERVQAIIALVDHTSISNVGPSVNIGPRGIKIYRFVAWYLPIKSTCLLSRKYDLSAPTHILTSHIETARSTVSQCITQCAQYFDHGRSQSLDTRLSLSSWATSHTTGH